jgi:hypothetical protein
MKFETFSSKVNILKTLSTVYQNKPKVKNKEKQANQFSHPHPNTVETREDENSMICLWKTEWEKRL